MSTDDFSSLSAVLPERPLRYDESLEAVLPPDWAQPLMAKGLETLEDLYDCAATQGAGWFRYFDGIGANRATALMIWLQRWGSGIGEVTPRFFLPGRAPAPAEREGAARKRGSAGSQPAQQAAGAAGQCKTPRALPQRDPEIRPLEEIQLPPELDGSAGINRAPLAGCALNAANDLEAIRIWLNARAGNPNTFANYRKEAERFLLWCIVEKRTALASIRAGDAAEYLRWLENLGRLDEKTFSAKWRAPQSRWLGPKNVQRAEDGWRPFNGPLSVASRRNAVVVVRQLFNFLKKTGYLIFNPFDQVSPKVPLLKGEGAPQAFADRSLTPEQWSAVIDRLDLIPEGWPRERMKLILMLGKSLGMRASEMLDARAGWITTRRIGFRERRAIEIVGKGSKVRRLPLNAEQIDIIESAMRARGFPGIAGCDPETPLLVNLGRGRHPNGAMSRSGLYRVLEAFFDAVANDIALSNPMDAAKLRASSTHWLRHTFAVTALGKMSVNVVQAAMGHASVATTGRYLSPEEEKMSEAMADMKAL